jgi:uncharacterized protein
MITKEEIKSIIIPILHKNGVLKASLFGSIVRSENNEKSDIDILVQFDDGKSLFDLIGLKLELEEKLKIKVDVLTYDSINSKIKDQILSEQEIIYA